MIRLVERTGLTVFSVALVIWLFSFLLESYMPSDLVIESVIENEEDQEKIKSGLEDSYVSSFSLTGDLNKAFEGINAARLDKYAYPESLIREMVNTTGDEAFSFDQAMKVFDINNPVQKYQFETLKSWGGWLEGTAYDSKEDLHSAIEGVTKNIEKWGIKDDVGYGDFLIKTKVYEIVKKSSKGYISSQPWLFFLLTYVLGTIGALLYILPKRKSLGPAGIKNDGIFKSSLKNKGWLGIALGTLLIVFYIVLYFYPEHMTAWIIMVDPLSYLIKNAEGGRFFLYGFMYTLAILIMGARMMIKYRHSPYQILRTCSVMFFQLAFAFLIPEILIRLNQPYFDFKNIWPLDYDFFFDYELDNMITSGSIGIFMLGWGIGLVVIGVPVLVYFFGKRWYCSWVCGCGGLAETLGDPFRQLSDKSLKAWKIERWSIHGVLVFAIIMTIGVLYTYWTGSGSLLGVNTYTIRSIYGSWIGAIFAGVIGTGFYPLMGNRVWCRFGCPLAAYLGLVQRFKSRFRITTNGGQCISCGNCSTYCEMGIDVRSYAQRGENIIRASCVGCGVCSAVCPRGVLNLENRGDDNRFVTPGLIGNDSFNE